MRYQYLAANPWWTPLITEAYTGLLSFVCIYILWLTWGCTCIFDNFARTGSAMMGVICDSTCGLCSWTSPAYPPWLEQLFFTVPLSWNLSRPNDSAWPSYPAATAQHSATASERPMKIDVYLPSGQRAAVSLPPKATVSNVAAGFTSMGQSVLYLLCVYNTKRKNLPIRPSSFRPFQTQVLKKAPPRLLSSNAFHSL